MFRPSRSEASYTARSSRHRYLFRSVRLNAVGWAAFIAALAVSGVDGYVLLGSPAAVLLPVLASAAIIGMDRWRWSQSPISVSWTDDQAEFERGVERVRAAGVPVEVDPSERTITATQRQRPRLLELLHIPDMPF